MTKYISMHSQEKCGLQQRAYYYSVRAMSVLHSFKLNRHSLLREGTGHSTNQWHWVKVSRNHELTICTRRKYFINTFTSEILMWNVCGNFFIFPPHLCKLRNKFAGKCSYFNYASASLGQTPELGHCGEGMAIDDKAFRCHDPTISSP
jgi:hypothetical protein